MDSRKPLNLRLLSGHKILQWVLGMSREARKSENAQPARGKADDVTGKQRPTVTTSGQVIWSTRDLLFPTGHAARSATRK